MRGGKNGSVGYEGDGMCVYGVWYVVFGKRRSRLISQIRSECVGWDGLRIK
jgi:hypothetical protein